MDALEHVDALFREYLLFRGFHETLEMFKRQKQKDKARGFQVEKIINVLLGHCHHYQAEELIETWEFLDTRFFSRLDDRFQETLVRLEASLKKYYIVNAIKRGHIEKVTEFFQICGERLLHSASEWQSWFSIPFIKSPEHDPAFSVYFTKEWKETFLVSLNNFLSQVFQNLKLPTVLRFNLERQNRRSIEMEIEFLKSERTRLLTINEIREAEIQKLRNALYSKNPSHQSVEEFPLQVSVRNKGQRDMQGELQAEVSDSNISEERLHIGSLHSNSSSPHLSQNAAIPRSDSDQNTALTNDKNLKEAQADENGASGEEENNCELTISVARFTTFSGHTTPISSCRYSGDGLSVASCSKDGTVRIWTPDSKQSSSRDATIYCNSEAVTLEWNTRTNKLLLIGTKEKGFRAWNVESKRIVSEAGAESSHPRVLDVKCSPVEPVFITAMSTLKESNNRGVVTVWNLKTFRPTHTLPLTNNPPVIHSVCFNHNGKLAGVAADDGAVRIFDINTRSCVMKWNAHDGTVHNIKFSSDQNSVYTLGSDGKLIEWSLHVEGSIINSFDGSVLGVEDSEIGSFKPTFAFSHATNGDLCCMLGTSTAPRAPLWLIQNADRDRIVKEPQISPQAPSFFISHESSCITSADWHPTRNIAVTGTDTGHVQITELQVSQGR